MSLRDNTNYGTWDCPNCHYCARLEAMDVDPHRPVDQRKFCPVCGGILQKNEIHYGPEGPSAPIHDFPDNLPMFPETSSKKVLFVDKTEE